MRVRWRSAASCVTSVKTKGEVTGQGHDRVASRRKVGFIQLA